MTKEELIKRYCCLQSLVVGLGFESQFAGDCFCPDTDIMGDHWRTDDQVIEFIEDAVIQAIKKRTGQKKSDLRQELAKRWEN